MANEKKAFLLTEEEHLWDVALRGIGVQLPDEYILRFKRLLDLYGLRGLEKTTIEDFVTIECEARKDLNKRMEKAEKEG